MVSGWSPSSIGGGLPLSRSSSLPDFGNRLFTQEDPIGIAGGLNLYGYANGGPINFSDPFGLDACQRLRNDEAREKCRERMKESREQEDEGKEEFDAALEQAGRCLLAGAELTARAGVDAFLLSAYGSAVRTVGAGLALAAEGQAISSGLILTTTLRGAGSTGAAELAAGRTLMSAGAAAGTAAATTEFVGLSMLPVNAPSFWRSGGLSACGR
jgi:uncharacterized protein RhaS with RHS repeats